MSAKVRCGDDDAVGASRLAGDIKGCAYLAFGRLHEGLGVGGSENLDDVVADDGGW